MWNDTEIELVSPTSVTPLLDSIAEFLFRVAFYIILSAVFAIFGIGANIVNIIVFIRQGLFSGGSTLNLFFLALADLGVVFTTFLSSITFAVIVADIPYSPFDPFSVFYLTVAWPHAIFTIANRVMTAYIAFERCMCVVLPFRVQSLFTPRKSLVYIIVIFSYTFLSHVPIYVGHQLTFVNLEESNQGETRNVTKLVLAFLPNRDILHDVAWYANYFVVSFASVIIVFVCTVITTAHINTSKEWRKTATGAASSNTAVSTTEDSYVHGKDGSSTTDTTCKTDSMPPESSSASKKNQNTRPNKGTVDKETRLVKMIVTISIIFLVCYIPELMLTVMKFVDDRIRVGGPYDRLAQLMYSIAFVVATFNSGINILVFYRMSTRYRTVFLECFRKNKSKE